VKAELRMAFGPVGEETLKFGLFTKYSWGGKRAEPAVRMGVIKETIFW
jgi:hypothetical protein